MKKEEIINYGIMVDPEKEYPVTYTIYSDGTSSRHRTMLFGKEMTENQIKEYLHYKDYFQSLADKQAVELINWIAKEGFVKNFEHWIGSKYEFRYTDQDLLNLFLAKFRKETEG